MKVLTFIIALLQVLDIVVHAATDQLEILRVASNLIMLIWLGTMVSGRGTTDRLAVAGAIAPYLVLNLIFLAREGFTNPEQGGELRIALFLFVFLTVALSTWLVSLRHRLPD